MFIVKFKIRIEETYSLYHDKPTHIGIPNPMFNLEVQFVKSVKFTFE